MKKLVSFLLCLVLSLCATYSVALAAVDDDDVFTAEQIEYYKSLGLQGTTVNVYNWGEYISDGSEDSMDVVSEFERLTGATVNYTNYESNENMYSKLAGGGVSYDVVVPSDYMIERLADEGMLQEIDWNNVPNRALVDEKYQNLYFDPEQKYSLCYNVGTTVLIYNKNLVSETPDSWSVLWDEQYKGKVLMFNNSRDAFAIAQAMLGQNFNSQDESDWNKAAELLAEQKDKTNPVYVMDEVFNLMESGEYAFATYYAGDYALMADNNPDLDFCFPKEGVNIFYDAFCIPTCAQNKKGAEAFINFMQEPQVALENSEFIYYASPNVTVRENEDSSLYGNEAVYPEEQPEGQYFNNLPQNILELQSDLWTRVKSGQLSFNSKSREKRIYIEFSVIVGLAVLGVGAKLIYDAKSRRFEDLSDVYEQNSK